MTPTTSSRKMDASRYAQHRRRRVASVASPRVASRRVAAAVRGSLTFVSINRPILSARQTIRSLGRLGRLGDPRQNPMSTLLFEHPFDPVSLTHCTFFPIPLIPQYRNNMFHHRQKKKS